MSNLSERIINRLEEYYRQQNSNEMLTDHDRKLACRVIEECQKVVMICEEEEKDNNEIDAVKTKA